MLKKHLQYLSIAEQRVPDESSHDCHVQCVPTFEMVCNFEKLAEEGLCWFQCLCDYSDSLRRGTGVEDGD